MEDDPTPKRNNQILRATSLVYSSLKFVSTLKQGRMQPDMVKTTPLCMSQYKRMFGTARIAEEKQDSIKVDAKSGHIVVLCRGQQYVFQALWPDGTLAITELELKSNFAAIVKDAKQVKDEDIHKTAIGAFTTEIRHKWAKLRANLTENNNNNKEIFNVIDSALFIVCLDEESPITADDRVANMLHGSYRMYNNVQVGSCCNRWYDKIQLIVCKNGAAGINFEHSTVDGLTVLRFASDVFADNIIQFAQSITKNTHGKNYISDMLQAPYRKPDKGNNDLDIEPKKMTMDLNWELQKSLRFAETQMSDLISRTETKTLEFRDYGKLFIVKNKMSPDGFVQVALNTAYYLLYGSFATAYESVNTKHYNHGRTEAGRTLSKEICEYAKNFDNPNLSNEEKLDSLQKCLYRQKITIKKCQSGRGVDRHLSGLKYMLKYDEGGVRRNFSFDANDVENPPEKKMKTPDIFKTNAYKTLKTTVLSTSNCGNPSLRMFGFGPVSEWGFGIGYIIKNDGLQFCISSGHRQTGRFVHTLKTYLHDVVQIMGIEKNATNISPLLKAQTNTNNIDMNELNLDGNNFTVPRGKVSWLQDNDFDDGFGNYGYFDMGDLPLNAIDNTSTPDQAIAMVRSKSFVALKRMDDD